MDPPWLAQRNSGYQANTVDDLASLRPALFATGPGHARFENFAYRALPDA